MAGGSAIRGAGWAWSDGRSRAAMQRAAFVSYFSRTVMRLGRHLLPMPRFQTPGTARAPPQSRLRESTATPKIEPYKTHLATSRSAAPTRKRPTSFRGFASPPGAARTRRGHLLIRSFSRIARWVRLLRRRRRGKSASAPPYAFSLRSLRLALISRCLPHSLADDEACLLARSSRTGAQPGSARRARFPTSQLI